jgi:hypothetical protein
MNLDDIRARHRPAIWHDTQWDPCDTDHPDACCSYCETFWPCDAAQLVALLTPERIAGALHDWWPEAGLDHIDAVALLAALTKETT